LFSSHREVKSQSSALVIGLQRKSEIISLNVYSNIHVTTIINSPYGRFISVIPSVKGFMSQWDLKQCLQVSLRSQSDSQLPSDSDSHSVKPKRCSVQFSDFTVTLTSSQSIDFQNATFGLKRSEALIC